MGASLRASCSRWLSLRGDSLPMITLFLSQGDFCATASSDSQKSPVTLLTTPTKLSKSRLLATLCGALPPMTTSARIMVTVFHDKPPDQLPGLSRQESTDDVKRLVSSS